MHVIHILQIDNVIVSVGHTDKSWLVGLFLAWPIGKYEILYGKKKAGTVKGG